jgi:hypothetical protein
MLKTANRELDMQRKQIAILIGVIVGAMGGVFLGAGADASWAALTSPIYVIGSVVAGAAALVGFLSKGPNWS